jgi:hypothetical protein
MSIVRFVLPACADASTYGAGHLEPDGENQQQTRWTPKIITPPQLNKIENFIRQSQENWLLYNLTERDPWISLTGMRN